MCIFKRTVIALSGSSAAGKTYLAERLAEKLVLPTRHCGEVVKKYASETGVHIGELTKADHEKLDRESLQWVDDNCDDGCIIEGRFLNFFLGNSDSYHVINVDVRASNEARQERFKKRGTPLQFTVDNSDDMDRTFAESQYGTKRTVDLTIDCSAPISIEELIEKLGSFTEND